MLWSVVEEEEDVDSDVDVAEAVAEAVVDAAVPFSPDDEEPCLTYDDVDNARIRIR